MKQRLLHDAEIAPGFRHVEEDLCGLSAFKEGAGAEISVSLGCRSD